MNLSGFIRINHILCFKINLFENLIYSSLFLFNLSEKGCLLCRNILRHSIIIIIKLKIKETKIYTEQKYSFLVFNLLLKINVAYIYLRIKYMVNFLLFH
jgi:hypothetical protein